MMTECLYEDRGRDVLCIIVELYRLRFATTTVEARYGLKRVDYILRLRPDPGSIVDESCSFILHPTIRGSDLIHEDSSTLTGTMQLRSSTHNVVLSLRTIIDTQHHQTQSVSLQSCQLTQPTPTASKTSSTQTRSTATIPRSYLLQ